MTYREWITAGVEAGWISAPVCLTHDGTPTTEAEAAEYFEGFDPCVFGCRVYGDTSDAAAQRSGVEKNFPAAVWRKKDYL